MNKNIFIAIISILTLSTSCENKSTDSESKVEIKHIESIHSLVNNNDTLTLVFNLSGNVSRRFDFIRFFKIGNELYLTTEIKNTPFEDENFNTPVKYERMPNDSLSFEFLLNKAESLELNSFDTINPGRFIMTIGKLNQWKKIYATDILNDSINLQYIRLYISIMHKIYPDLDIYKPYWPLEIVEV